MTVPPQRLSWLPLRKRRTKFVICRKRGPLWQLVLVIFSFPKFLFAKKINTNGRIFGAGATGLGDLFACVFCNCLANRVNSGFFFSFHIYPPSLVNGICNGPHVYCDMGLSGDTCTDINDSQSLSVYEIFVLLFSKSCMWPTEFIFGSLPHKAPPPPNIVYNCEYCWELLKLIKDITTAPNISQYLSNNYKINSSSQNRSHWGSFDFTQ